MTNYLIITVVFVLQFYVFMYLIPPRHSWLESSPQMLRFRNIQYLID